MRGNIQHQYRIIAGRAGWIDRSSRGVVRVDGPDRLAFLHALVTNDVMSLRAAAGVSAAYLTPQGRMIADLEILNRGDHVLVLVAGSAAASLTARLDALIFAEQVDVADVSGDWCEIVVTGGDAANVAAAVFDCDRDALSTLAELDQIDLAEGFIVRGGDSPLPVFRALIPAGAHARVVLRLTSLDVPAVPPEIETALRIEAGRSAWGVDLFEDTIPLEAGLLERSISTSKGCYVGQEVIIRILHRGGGRVAKRLVQLVVSAGTDDVPAAGTLLAHDADVVGRVTSAAYSPVRDAVVALGYVHRDVAEIGRRLGVGTGGSTAEIVGFAR